MAPVSSLKRRLSILGVVALALGAVQPAMADDHEAMAGNPDDAIKYREAIMEIIGSNMTAMVQIAKGEVKAPVTTFSTHANMLAMAGKLSYAAFKQNTHGQGKEKTTAKENVWTDWDKFKEGLDDMNDMALRVANYAADGNMDLAKGAIGDLGKACKACHDDFRQK